MDQGDLQTKSEPFWLFMHIPKAAGTTLRSIVDAQYGADNVLTYYNQPNRQLLDNLPYVLMDPRRSYRALIGHFSFGVHEGLPKPARYVTFLRDPVRRAISAYHEVIKTNPARFSRADGTRMGLEEVLDRRPEALANQQLKMLSGLESEAASDDIDMAAAKRNLAFHFAFVGTMERYNESLLLLTKRLGWRPCLYGRLNEAGWPAPLGRHIERLLARMNEFERSLYDWIDQMLTATIAEEGDSFALALAELNAALAAHQDNACLIITAAELPKVAAYLQA